MHVRPQSHRGAGTEVGHARQERPRVDELDIGSLAEHVIHDQVRLDHVRRARGVRDDSPRACRVDRRVQQAALQGTESGEVLRGTPPARLGATAQGTDAGAGRIEENAVCGAGRDRVSAVRDAHLRGIRTECLAHELGPMGVRLHADESGTALAGEAGEQRGLAARTGGEVDPGGIRPVDGHIDQRERDQLASFVLDPGAAVAHDRHLVRSALGERGRQRRPGPRLDSRQREEFLDGHPSRHERGASGTVVGIEQRAQAVRVRRPAMACERLA